MKEINFRDINSIDDVIKYHLIQLRQEQKVPEEVIDKAYENIWNIYDCALEVLKKEDANLKIKSYILQLTALNYLAMVSINFSNIINKYHEEHKEEYSPVSGEQLDIEPLTREDALCFIKEVFIKPYKGLMSGNDGTTEDNQEQGTA